MKLPKTRSLGAALTEECHAKRSDNYTANTASKAWLCANVQNFHPALEVG